MAEFQGILIPGLFATALLTVILTASQGLGWSRISFPYLLGTVVTPHRDAAMVIGLVVHFVWGIVFTFLYAYVFSQWGGASIPKGVVLGAFHGTFVMVVVFTYLPYCHPRMASIHHGPSPTRRLEPPGVLALNYGRGTPLITLLAHVGFGALLGAFF